MCWQIRSLSFTCVAKFPRAHPQESRHAQPSQRSKCCIRTHLEKGQKFVKLTSR